MPLQEPLVRNPPSKIVNAASLTVAALRPAPAQSLPALPTRKESDQYYWGNIHEDDLCSGDNHRKNGESDSEELKDLCSWSSDSYDDIL
ncbi:unnamed protein product [Pseudo-nitzschia multistriata]|uniref:Uncharacterized protein n=1 Tax=Pseudo-nitzschia multistriata TaxID=183589 RepID=A0A448ZIP7_9STRA|nr:unnamed protein product [Pseudo-nitzschia multistriata]VEU44339.1 unnamed protein product [Pseudo-nitzschia multistriata]